MVFPSNDFLLPSCFVLFHASCASHAKPKQCGNQSSANCSNIFVLCNFLQCVPPIGAVFVFVSVFVFVFVFAIHARQGLNNVASSRSSAVHKSFLDRSRKAFGQPKHHTLFKKLAILFGSIKAEIFVAICCNIWLKSTIISLAICILLWPAQASHTSLKDFQKSTMIYLAILYTWFIKS